METDFMHHRVKTGMSQKLFAEKFGLSVYKVSNIENGGGSFTHSGRERAHQILRDYEKSI